MNIRPVMPDDAKDIAGIALPNEASVTLHQSVGYRPLGVYEGVGFKLGAWRDVGWWSKELQPLAANPQAPRLPAPPRSLQP